MIQINISAFVDYGGLVPTAVWIHAKLQDKTVGVHCQKPAPSKFRELMLAELLGRGLAKVNYLP